MIGTYHPDRHATGIVTPEPPSAEDVQSLVASMADEARSFIEEEVNQKRADAIDYYFGRPFGNEEPGRSRVVSTDVRDGIQACMPGLMRTFTGSEQAIEARPRNAEDTDSAEQQTAFARQVFFSDNDGFRITHDWLLNGLREGYGVVKVWWDEEQRVTTEQYSGLSAEDLLGLEDDPMVELADVRQDAASSPEEPIYSAMVTRITPDGRIRVEACPPEEIIFNRSARSKESALLFGHCKEMRVTDVIALGYTAEQLEGSIGDDDMDDTIEQARNPGAFSSDSDTSQFALRRILYSELFMLLDLDGKGRADLYKVCTVGGNFKVLNIEPAAERPFADFVPLPEPHTILGQSWADLLKDTQEVKSAIRRGMLDSLALVLNPRRVILDGAVELDDVLNTEIGAIIRERVMNATRMEDHRFVGADAFPMLEYEDSIAENRTGRTKGAQGLNADSLQSSTKLAVSGTLTAAHQRAELLARIFADSQKELFKLIIAIARRHQQKARMLKLRGKWVAVDPKNWDTELDFEVAVGLGTGLVEERKGALMEILAQQSEATAQYGPNNPLTSPARIRNTLAKLANLAGYPDAEQFWKEVDDEAIQKAQLEEEQANPDGKKTPEDKLADAQKEITAMKSQSALQLKQIDLEAKKLDAQMRERELANADALDQEKLALERQKMILDFELKKAEIEARFAADVEMARIKQEFEERRLVAETDAHREKAHIDAEAKRYAADKGAEAKVVTGTKRKITLSRDAATGRPTGATVETTGGSE
jgi:hypothetical protein